MAKIGKQQVVQHIAGQTKLSKKDVAAVIKLYHEVVIQHAKAGTALQ